MLASCGAQNYLDSVHSGFFCPCRLPGPCEATLQAAAAERRAATLVYVDAELMVELITKDELQAAFSAAGAGEYTACHAFQAQGGWH